MCAYYPSPLPPSPPQLLTSPTPSINLSPSQKLFNFLLTSIPVS